jgi:DNA repair exonuclease SbcCD ATPase subunit
MTEQESNLQETLEEEYYEINPSWLIPDVPLGFNLYIYLPQNNKLINYSNKESSITSSKIDIFIRNKSTKFYCPKDQLDALNSYTDNVKAKLKSDDAYIPEEPVVINYNEGKKSKDINYALVDNTLDYTDHTKKDIPYTFTEDPQGVSGFDPEKEKPEHLKSDYLPQHDVSHLQGGDIDFDIEMIRKKTDSMLDVVTKVKGSIPEDEEHTVIHDVTEKIKEEINKIKGSLSTLEDEDIFIIENCTLKIKDNIQHVKSLASTSNQATQSKIGNVNELLTYYLGLLDNIITSPELIDIHKLFTEFTKDKENLTDIITTTYSEELSAEATELDESIKKLKGFLSSLTTEDKSESYRFIDQMQSNLERIYEKASETEEVRKLVYMMHHHLEATHKYIDMTMNVDADHLQSLMDSLHFENKLIEDLKELDEDNLSQVLADVKDLMMRVKEIVELNKPTALDDLNNIKWDINSKVAILIDFRDNIKNNIKLRNLISKNIISITTYLQKAKREIYKRQSSTYEAPKAATEEQVHALGAEENETLERSEGEVFDGEKEQDQNIHEGKKYSDSTMKALKTLLEEQETRLLRLDAENEQYKDKIKEIEETKSNLDNAKLGYEQQEYNIQTILEKKDREIEKLQHELHMLSYKLNDKESEIEKLEEMTDTSDIEEQKKNIKNEWKTSEIKRKSLEKDNENLHKQLTKTQERYNDMRKKLSESVNIIRQKDTEIKKAQKAIEVLNLQVQNTLKEKEKGDNKAFEQTTVIEQRLKQTENRIETLKEEYKNLNAEYGKLTQEKDKNKKIITKLEIHNDELKGKVESLEKKLKEEEEKSKSSSKSPIFNRGG